jgi:hypothetical protein
VAQWLEDLAQSATAQLEQAGAPQTPDARRTAVDIAIQAALGRFFAARFRAGTLYAIYERAGDSEALDQALKKYRAAREIWAKVAETARVYAADITVGEQPWLRGHWSDRLAAIDADIAQIAKRTVQPTPEPRAKAIAVATGTPNRGDVECSHTPAAHLPEKQPLYIELQTKSTSRLWYRHLNQAERWRSTEMRMFPEDDRLRAVIPAEYVDSPYPVQYYFEVRQGSESVLLYPGFDRTLANQPYFVVRPR